MKDIIKCFLYMSTMMFVEIKLYVTSSFTENNANFAAVNYL